MAASQYLLEKVARHGEASTRLRSERAAGVGEFV